MPLKLLKPDFAVLEKISLNDVERDVYYHERHDKHTQIADDIGSLIEKSLKSLHDQAFK